MELGAKNGTRTRDPDLGKVVLYQLSYFRKYFNERFRFCVAKVATFFYPTKFFRRIFAFYIFDFPQQTHSDIFAPPHHT